MVTEVRQRVTRDQYGRRGTARDPVWVNRRLLLTGADHLTAKQWARLNATLDAGDPTNEIGAACALNERLRMLLAEHEPSRIRWRLADFYDAPAIHPSSQADHDRGVLRTRDVEALGGTTKHH